MDGHRFRSVDELLGSKARGSTSGRGTGAAPEQEPGPPGLDEASASEAVQPESTPSRGSLALPRDAGEREVVLAAHALLARRAHARRELEQRLARKGFEADRVALALAWLEERGLLDDGAYASSAVRTATEQRGWGQHKVRRWLEARGVAGEVAAQAWSASAADGELARALELGARQGARGKTREQIFRFLSSRGFATDVARRAATEHGMAQSDEGDAAPGADADHDGAGLRRASRLRRGGAPTDGEAAPEG